MNYVGRLLSNFKGFYNEINSATLTGAIDVIIVKQEDGTYVSSPFHVRFGKMGVLQPREKVVDMEINGEPVDLHMKLGEAGEAFFVQEEESEDLPAHLATSPIPSALDLMEAGLEDLHQQVMLEEQRSTPILHPSALASWNEAEDTPKEIRLSESASVPSTVALNVDVSEKGLESGTLGVTPPRPRSVTPTPSVETGVGTQTGTPPMSPEISKDSSSNSISGASAMPKKDSQTSLYHSVHTSFDHGSDDESQVRRVSHDDELQNSPSLRKKNSGSDDDRKSDVSTQTDMTGAEVATIRKTTSSSDVSLMASPKSSSSLPSVKLNVTSDSSTSSITISKTDTSIKLSSSPSNSRTKISSQKKKRRKKIERKRRELQLKESVFINVDEANEGDSSSVDGQPENLLFDMDLSAEDSDDLAMSRTVSMPIIDGSRRRSLVGEWANSHRASAFHPFSDGDITPIMSPIGTRPPSPKSDTEYETNQQCDQPSQTFLTGDDFETIDEVKWKWGELPESTPRATKAEDKDQVTDELKASGGLFSFMRKTKKVRHQPEQEGIYLDDLNLEEMDPEVAALYLYHPKGSSNNQMLTIKDEDNESGRGGSLPQSPLSHEHHRHESGASQGTGNRLGNISMSLCGGLKETEGDISPEKFAQFQVTFDAFNENPSIINNPNLVIGVGDKYYNWQIAGPIIMSMLAFQRPLTQGAIDSLVKQHMPKKDSRRRGWIWWRTTDEATSAPAENAKAEDGDPMSAPPSVLTSPHPERQQEKAESDTEEWAQQRPELDPDEPQPMQEGEVVSEVIDHKVYIYRKSLKLTSEQIEQLNLQDGVNDVSFSVTTQYQGTSRCFASIYLWNWDDRIIISDIDGTITKSDVLGQLFPMVGKDWSQAGIANLYNEIHRNGYKFLYLSARAIGQSKITRDYLRSVQQGKVSLPDGPLLLSPSSLISAFHREVIERKPEEFKISCLRDISALFPQTRNPFYAGFGNKINDVWAYRAMGIPTTRIFTVNHKGELKMELTHAFQSSYTKLGDVADHFFPPLVHKDSTDGAEHGKVHAGNFPASEEFSTFTYWREPIADIDLDLAAFNERTQEATS